MKVFLLNLYRDSGERKGGKKENSRESSGKLEEKRKQKEPMN